MDRAKRVRITLANASSPVVWIRMPSTSNFEEFKTLCCSRLHRDPETTELKLLNGTFDSLDVLQDDDLVELHAVDYSDANAEEEWITFNVGGTIFSTSRLTITSMEPTSILAKMIEKSESGKSLWNPHRDRNGAILIDRSGKLFEPLLNYLRTGKLALGSDTSLQSIHNEAEYFAMDNLLEQLRPHVNSYDSENVLELSPSSVSDILSRADVVRTLMVSSSSQELRFQGMNFQGCDLSKLDLRYINFRLCNLRGANLTSANLSYCNMERCDLTDATLDNAVMFAVKMPCAIMERISMRSVNMDDPAGCRANLEGVNLKNAVLDNSVLNGCNFRVANLKDASLKNCELKQASFPGANLERCDLSGSNLFEANLRGANLVDTNFGQLANALHMAQAI